MRDKWKERERRRLRIKERIRKKVIGTAERPRLVVYRGIRNFEAQMVDDLARKTIFSVNSRFLKAEDAGKTKGKVGISKALGKVIAERAKEKNISSVVFDRGGYRYHGRIKAFAEGAREGGLKF